MFLCIILLNAYMPVTVCRDGPELHLLLFTLGMLNAMFNFRHERKMAVFLFCLFVCFRVTEATPYRLPRIGSRERKCPRGQTIIVPGNDPTILKTPTPGQHNTGQAGHTYLGLCRLTAPFSPPRPAPLVVSPQLLSLIHI